MRKNNQNGFPGYREDAMIKPVCLICGERVGKYVYRGKSICPVCLNDIRANH